MQMYGCSNKFASGTIIANNVDINKLIDLATVCVTILSQAAYVALIREKPVVMLGYNQLKEKAVRMNVIIMPDFPQRLKKLLTTVIHVNRKRRL